MNNPCYAVEIGGLVAAEDRESEVLELKDCTGQLRAAEKFENGKLAPYLALCLFGGLRPFEAARLTWAQVNLTDGEKRRNKIKIKRSAGRVRNTSS